MCQMRVRQWQLILPLVLSAACSSEVRIAPDPAEDSFPESQAELRRAVQSIVEDTAEANLEGLRAAHLDSYKFTKFGPRSFERQDVEGANESESAFFGSISSYRLDVQGLKIDVFGEVGIATYYPYVSYVQDGVTKSGSGRQTLVFLKTAEGWKIVHEHGTPRFERPSAAP